MRRAANYLFVRHRHNWIQLIRFGLVGGSGVLVNNLVFILANKIWSHPNDIVFGIPLTDFNVRWQLAYSTLAFLVANLCNFQLNRSWTFQSAKHAGWWREYWPFLVVGLGAQVVTMVIETLLINPTSPVYGLLPEWLFTGETGLTNRFYWAHLIAILITVPITFVLNKLWTFSAVRGRQRHAEHAPPVPMVATVVAPEVEVEAEAALAEQAAQAERDGQRERTSARSSESHRDQIGG